MGEGDAGVVPDEVAAAGLAKRACRAAGARLGVTAGEEPQPQPRRLGVRAHRTRRQAPAKRSHDSAGSASGDA